MPLASLISANFIFYITFVQFSLLGMIEKRFSLSIESLGLPLGLMALTGALSSVLTGYLLDRSSTSLRKVFNIACFLSILQGFAAVYSITIYDHMLLNPFFIAIGFLMGINGVLVVRVAEAWPAKNRGTAAGWTMAVVYLAANLMAGFITMPERIALINAIVAVIIGSLCILSKADIHPSADPRKFHGGYLKIVLFLAALVAIDSFVFHLEINREELYRYTWEGRWLWNGVVHAVSAIFAGLLWDRRMERALFLFTLSAFALSLALLILFPIGSFTGLISTLFYNIAVSFYGILILISWFYVDSGIGSGFKIGAGMAVVGWVASPAGIAVAMKSMSLPIPALFSGPLILIMLLFLIKVGKKLN